MHPDMPPEYLDSILTGDARELAKRIPDGSVDLVFTDPPYSRDVLPLYGWLAEEAARVLKPDGFCFALCGLSHFSDVMRLMSRHLDYFWTLCDFQPGSNSAFNPRRVVCKWRPIVVFTKGFEPKVSRWLVDGRATVRDKRFHDWGQSPDFAAMSITAHSQPGEVVWDPFAGGGTVPAVCKSLGRHYVASEIDPDTTERARRRVVNTMPPLLLPEEPEWQPTLDLVS